MQICVRGALGMKFRFGVCALLLVAGIVHGATAPPRIDAEDYRRAASLSARNALTKVKNSHVSPVWLPDRDVFWYRRQTADGWEFVAVDADRATRAAAFDHGRLASALSATLGKPIDAARLPFRSVTFLERGAAIEFTVDNKIVTCQLASASCKSTTKAPVDGSVILSPDRRQAAFVRDHNLWLRTVATGAERQLTHDGAELFAYGRHPDSDYLFAPAHRALGMQMPLYGLDWSPDSKWIVATRVDERKLPNYGYLQYLSEDGRRPRAVDIHTSLSGEGERAVVSVSIIDSRDGTSHQVADADKELTTQRTLHWWDPSSTRFLALERGNFSKESVLVEVSVNGARREVLRETAKTFLLNRPLLEDEPAFRFLPGSNEAIWYSQRDGWGHLYLVDVASGKIKSQITKGDWSVQNIVRVDERQRRVYFTAVGREAGEDVYFRHLYSAGLDGRGLRLLTPGNADHRFPGAPDPVRASVPGREPAEPVPALISPSGKFIVDSFSTLTTAPTTVLRREDGTIALELEKADVSELAASGWIQPESFIAKAADGKTDLYGYIIKPAGYDPARRYPVIDAIYGGPQIVTAPHNFIGGVGGATAEAQALAQLGFVVINVDARGTPLRSKAFHDYIYNNMQEFGLEDHVAVIEQLARRHPFMDLNRVGIFGHSFGGFTSLKGILGYPDFFKACVSSAGPYDLFQLGYIWDGFFEPPRFKSGLSHSSGADDRPTNWGAIDLTRQVSRLKGDLMLAYADMDENARPFMQVKLVQALIAANKDFDLVYMPGRNHYFTDENYFVRRRWDFFVRHLMQVEPPKNVDLESAGE